jgi:hypothetical protein
LSLIHSTIVGHFDPATLGRFGRRPVRSLDVDAAKELLNRFPPYVASRVEFLDGYAECWWADRSLNVSDDVYKYAYLLAREQNCIAAETPVCYITYPDEAKQIQADAWQRWRDENPPQERESAGPPVFNPPAPGPCPYCGQPLRTAIARQCRFCKMDWHDPTNAYHRA